MTGLRTLLHALLHRAGTSLVILLVALCASAAATIGPTYYVAAKHSILQDTLISTSVVGRGVQIPLDVRKRRCVRTCPEREVCGAAAGLLATGQ